jgi:toluene monooxygenase system protein E
MSSLPRRPSGVAPRKTYSHLADRQRMPTEYELVSTGLHDYTRRGGFEVNVPIAAWYEQYQSRSPLRCRDWERFRDPRETTYAKYTRIQTKKEIFVDGILQSIDEIGYDRGLGEAWRATLARAFAPFRYPFHGLQMIAAYLGQMGPSGQITIACAFQTADEIRRVQRIAYRMRQLQQTYPGFGEESRACWQSDPIWQPLREAVERLLVTYDWGEAIVALSLSLKPMIDELFLAHFAALAWQEGDTLLREILFSLDEDARWHREWSLALFQLAVEDDPDNRKVIQGFLDRWHPRTRRAIEALAPVLSADPERTVRELDDLHGARLRALGLDPPRSAS